MTKKKKRKRYTEQFKAEALRAVETRGDRTIADVAAGLGVTEQLLHSWACPSTSSRRPSDRFSGSASKATRSVRRSTVARLCSAFSADYAMPAVPAIVSSRCQTLPRVCRQALSQSFAP